MMFCFRVRNIMFEISHCPTLHDILMITDTGKSCLSNCWFLQSERWLPMAVTCSQRSWYKVHSGRQGKPPFSHLTQPAWFLCITCCIMWTPQSEPPKNTHPQTEAQSRAEAQTGSKLFSFLCGCVCYHLLNVCVSLRLLCFKFSDVIMCSRLYSGFSHSPWLPPSGWNRESAAREALYSPSNISDVSHHKKIEICWLPYINISLKFVSVPLIIQHEKH